MALGQFALRTPDLKAVMREAVASVKGTLEVELCAVLRTEPARGCLTVWATSGWGRGADAPCEIPLDGNTQEGLAAFTGQPVVIADARREMRLLWSRGFLLERGMRSGAAVPFGGESDALGVLVAHARQPERFAENELYFLQSVAMVLGAAVQRADAESRVGRSQRQLFQALESIIDPFVVVGRDWRVIYANLPFRERLRAWGREDVDSDFRRTPVWQHPEAKAALEAAMAQGTPCSFELSSAIDGQWFHVYVSINVEGLCVYFHNVGELVRRNRELSTRARQQMALAAVAKAAVGSRDIDEILQHAVRIVAQTLDVEFARIMELSEDRSSLTLRAGVGWQPELVGTFVTPFDPQTHVGHALLANEPVTSEDARTETRMHTSSLLSSHGIVSGVNVVIGSTGKPRGSLGAHSRRPRVYTNDEIVFLGSVASVLGTALERHKAYGETTQLNRRLSDVFNGISEGFYIVDRDWTLTYANAKLLEHIGQTYERTIGHNFFEAYPEMSAETQAALRSANAAGKQARFEIFSQKYQRWYEVDAYPTGDGMLFYSRDVSERKKSEELVRSLNADLERRVAERTAELRAANRELESFSYSVSHDLRAPLRAIDGFSLALLEDFGSDLKPEATAFLERVRSSTARMGRLIDDLLKLSRVGRRELTRREFDLSELAREVVEDLREREPGRHVDVSVQTGLRATCDRALLRIALENLIENAWKFTRRTAQARIEIGSLETSANGAFFVRDNGVGFDMTYADKLFRAFQRLHATEEFEGTGIGLATVARIVARHGGRVWAQAEVGSGATFYVNLEPGSTGA
jgi:signal transduction histidine kinase